MQIHIWGRLGFDSIYLDMTASGSDTLNLQLKLNDETEYSFAPNAYAFA